MTRFCNRCSTTKPLEDFPNNRTMPLGRGYQCKDCRKIYDKQHYEANAVRRRKQMYASKARTVKTNKALMWEILQVTPCADCGLVDPIVMEFDHSEDKKYNIGAMVGNSYSWTTIQKELAKGEFVCANCHRHRTMSRGGWWRTLANGEV